MKCRLCLSEDMHPVPFTVPPERGVWHRCGKCGSDSNALDYDRTVYEDRDAYNAQIGFRSVEEFRDGCRWNAEWIHENALMKCGMTVLEIGTWHGAFLDNMRVLGWHTEGFDVVPVPFNHHNVTVADRFEALRPFAVVAALEVFEHVPSPVSFLGECWRATVHDGIFHLTTPLPMDSCGLNYQREHLLMPSKSGLHYLLLTYGFLIIGVKEWEPYRYAVLCRAVKNESM